MFCLKKGCNENLSQKLNEAGSEEIEWGLGQELEKSVAMVTEADGEQYQNITICNATYDLNYFCYRVS